MSDLVGYLRSPKTTDSEIISVLMEIHKYVTKKEEKKKKKEKKTALENTRIQVYTFLSSQE